MNFVTLPSDVIYTLRSYLSLGDRFHLSQTCRKWDVLQVVATLHDSSIPQVTNVLIDQDVYCYLISRRRMYHVLNTYDFDHIPYQQLKHVRNVSVAFHDVVNNNATINDVVVYIGALILDFYKTFQELHVPIRCVYLDFQRVNVCVQEDVICGVTVCCHNYNMTNIERCFVELLDRKIITVVDPEDVCVGNQIFHYYNFTPASPFTNKLFYFFVWNDNIPPDIDPNRNCNYVITL